MNDRNKRPMLDQEGGRLLLGYARVSTDGQDLTASGTSCTRPDVPASTLRRSPAPDATGRSWPGCSITCGLATW